ncbi:hypothetical protein A3A78_02445 [candidate division WWE3 bacterium RIFCSPLOWO2_01_FULL_41_18]|uniref:DNA recombination protein RmuC n=1 Tax=candidate division WWE3 bacterium RIFCSPLOWO2_01_FULL_41_18 TaxID=1802625 RepID=A0A1F4VFC6_UNCKA|nr:MAG: hypothetical protein A3A78_02445 [candidate division WWE3 bacterium RIFCSPLOWO2_01_FULL_41_18]
MDNTLTILILALGFVLLFIFLAREIKKLKGESESEKVLMEWLKSMKGTLELELSEQRRTLMEQNKMLGDRLDNAARVVGDVQKELGKVSEFSKGMRDLQDALLAPKSRGNVGEQILEDLLSQILPKSSYEMQYMFRGGDKVDAVVKTDKGLIPIDSKFPMENFRQMISSETEEERSSVKKVFVRDVKKHVDDISKKYILPSEGTIDYALMYIPSESVYYETAVNNPELENYARDRKIFFVSPNTFYYYLQVILMGLQQKELAENARKIWGALGTLKKETEKFGGELTVLDGHLNRARGSMDGVLSRYSSFLGKIDSLKFEEKEDKLLE